MNLVLAFFAGMFLTNGVPHLVSGIAGKSHMTLLAKNSSALTNVVWAYMNFFLGIWVLNLSGGNLATLFSLDNYSLSFLVGSLFMAISNAWLFSNPNARFPWFKK
nr:hypothetical protein [Candidatus Levybacteria bacterium]